LRFAGRSKVLLQLKNPLQNVFGTEHNIHGVSKDTSAACGSIVGKGTLQTWPARAIVEKGTKRADYFP
jgi:hypothetical protein